MPRTKHTEPNHEVTDRDHVMARLAAARCFAQSAIDAIDEVIGLFVEPDDDPKGKKRLETLAAALDTIGCATRALESAEAAYPSADPTEVEPWDEDDDDEED